jgi:DNA helicase-4
LNDLEQPDFAEQIHGAADSINNGEYLFDFTHVLVDEFQDISFDRFRLLNAMQTANPKIEMTYVGDDWQSIYRFGGSDISIMRDVSKPTMKRKRVDLDATYRLPQNIADISSQFILKNPNQLEKKVVSKSEIENLGNIYIHWDTRYRDSINNVEQICTYIGDNAKNPEFSLRILGRYQSNLPKLNDIEEFWQGPIDISTVHAAKGLESDYVIVVDLVQDIRGFPSTIEDDPVLQMVLPNFEEFEHEEERRLFYVAITRSRIETHLISPMEKPSLFTLEMLEDNLGTHIGVPQDTKILCPKCSKGTIIKKNNNSYCSNIPTCEFFTPFCNECNKPMGYLGSNKQRYVCENHPKLIYENCNACSWGALVPRINSATKEVFFSCHTWKITSCRGKNKIKYTHKK